jgi:hypothetical protein
MLLGHEEITVTSGFRLFDYVSARIELRTVPVIGQPPSLGSTIFVLVTLGDLGSGQAIQADTNGFNLSDIPDSLELHKRWKELVGKGRIECGFFEFLLSHLRGSPEVRLEFPVRNGQVKNFVIRLGTHVELSGRFPADVDVLSKYFYEVEVLQD